MFQKILNLFKTTKDIIIEDQLETIKRLNNELDERIEFEQKLISIIEQRDLIILGIK